MDNQSPPANQYSDNVVKQADILDLRRAMERFDDKLDQCVNGQSAIVQKMQEVESSHKIMESNLLAKIADVRKDNEIRDQARTIETLKVKAIDTEHLVASRIQSEVALTSVKTKTAVIWAVAGAFGTALLAIATALLVNTMKHP